jgi:hypothetical protein
MPAAVDSSTGKESIDAGKRDLRFRSDAEPCGEDRIEDHDRHRVEAGEDRQQEVPQPREAATAAPAEDAAAAGDHHRQRHFHQGNEDAWP